MIRRRSVLFVRPDYHCSFFYRDELRKMGWRADIYVPWKYPEKLLYSTEDILRPWRVRRLPKRPRRAVNHALGAMWWLRFALRYRTHIYYGRPPALTYFERALGLERLFGRGFSVELALARALGIRLVYLPTGCHDQETKENFTLLDDGNVCGNCGAWDRCDDARNSENFARISRYFDVNIGTGELASTQYETTALRWKSIDLTLWAPGLPIPDEHRLPPTRNLRILHSNFLKESKRSWRGRNIKGSPFVHAAVEQLKEEGHPVEYFFVDGVKSRDMRFYQAQADIVVEQLIYGWWGSTFVEAAALGKPVVCYLRPDWKTRFMEHWGYRELPVIEATTTTIYEALKRLVVDEEYRERQGSAARSFAVTHFDPVDNARALAELLEGL